MGEFEIVSNDSHKYFVVLHGGATAAAAASVGCIIVGVV